ncbi:MAG: hypothetical protein WC343_15090 [Bacilli bacterium]|jgi:hypothetical protein
MSGATVGLIAGVLAVLLIFVAVILSTLVGAVCGWVVGLTPLGGMVLHALAGFGVTGIPLTDLGALVGFVSGFFSSRVGSKDD